MNSRTDSIFDAALLRRAMIDAALRLNPRALLGNPVMLVVEVGAALTSALWALAMNGQSQADPLFIGQVSAWLWGTVLFGNLAETLAEGRGKAQADALRAMRAEVPARRYKEFGASNDAEEVPSTALRKGDVVIVEAGELIPADGEIIEGVASVNESAITGESAPVIRAAGGDRSAVTGGTRVVSDFLIIRVSADPGEGFLDRMIGLVEGAKRAKTPLERALEILLAALTLVFIVACATLLPYSRWAVEQAGRGAPVELTILISLLVCLIPTTIGGLLSAIGIAGMDRMMRANVLAMSGRAVEAAGDVDVLMMDKTGTITHGNRQARELVAAPGVSAQELADAAALASHADETPEGQSIVALAASSVSPEDAAAGRFVPFTAQTRMSGLDLPDRALRKGASDAVARWVGADLSSAVRAEVERVAREGGTPLVVAERRGDAARVLGVVALRDVLKDGIAERFGELRRMGIKTIMITGDNPLTAAAIAAQAGVDDFLAEATPEAKLEMIQRHQREGHMVAMTGDGTNDAPALAQAHVAVAMNSGTQAAKEAANLVDLDSDPTKLLEIVAIGKQLLMTRGALTTFSLANDVAKYFAILPAAFVMTYPALGALNVMGLSSPKSAVLSAVIFNALIIIGLIPLALRGVPYRALPASVVLRRHLLIYGVGGLIVPFIGIKLIDLIVSTAGLA
jgi:potassium-transporting ATPase ATP-binding subunit